MCPTQTEIVAFCVMLIDASPAQLIISAESAKMGISCTVLSPIIYQNALHAIYTIVCSVQTTIYV